MTDGLPIGLSLLRANAAPGAFHNSAERYDQPKCHPHTRVAVINEIMTLASDEEKKSFFTWLYGPAGSGKTAIADSIAELCHDEGKLAASFFFSRGAGGRKDATHFVSSIACQLTMAIPEIQEWVGAAVDRDPMIFTRSLSAQMQALIVKPLNEAAEAGGSAQSALLSRPRFIIIDGLDECDDPKSQTDILQVLLKAVRQLSIPLFFLVASRPEYHIRDMFNRDQFNSVTNRIVLDDKYDPDADIERYLRSSFDDIRRRHPLSRHLPQLWPSDEEIIRIVQKSSGHFIYAATVIRFVESYRHRPMERLKIIFGLSPPNSDLPFVELDALFTHILSSVVDIDRVLQVLSLLLTVLGMATSSHLEELLSCDQGEIRLLLVDLHSIIRVPESDTDEIRILHGSFRDYLIDRSRSGPFFIDLSEAYAKLAVMYINHIKSSQGMFCYSSAKTININISNVDNISQLTIRRRLNKVLMLSKKSEVLIGALIEENFLVPHVQWMQTSQTIRKEIPVLMRSLWQSEACQSHYADGPH